MKDLSICIPVHNCGNYLPLALESILKQVDSCVEVVVYDGGSTDGTEELMLRYAARGVRYHRAPERGGIDRDMARVVALATGRYCWLFSGDDVMRPGAIHAIRHWLMQDADVYVCRHAMCDLNMVHRMDHVVLHPVHEPLAARLEDVEERLTWFRRAASTEAFFSFISGLVVRKDAWDRGTLDERFIGSCWAHAARLLALSSSHLRVVYVPDIWLDQRGDNDSFSQAGVVNRFRIAIAGYPAIASALFGESSEEAFHIRRVLRSEYPLRVFLYGKHVCRMNPEGESRALLDQLHATLHQDPGLALRIERWAYALVPAWCTTYMFRGMQLLRRVGLGF